MKRLFHPAFQAPALPHIVAFTGHRPRTARERDPNSSLRVSVLRAMIDALEKLKEDHQLGVISGGALWVDQDAAIAAKLLDIPYVVAVPCRGQDARWPRPARKEYQRILDGADNKLAVHLARRGEVIDGGAVIVHDGPYRQGVMKRRDHWMVDHADSVISVWDGRRKGGTYLTRQYALAQGKPLTNIDPRDYD